MDKQRGTFQAHSAQIKGGGAPQMPPPGAGSNLVYNGFKAACLGIVTSGTPAARVDVIADSIKVMLIGTTTPYTANNDHRFVSSAAGSELTGVSGYTGGFGGAGRKTLASRTLSADDTNDWGIFDAADVLWTALGTGDTIGGAIVFKELTSDALSPMIAYFALTNTPTNGSDVTLVWSTSPSGLLTLS